MTKETCGSHACSRVIFPVINAWDLRVKRVEFNVYKIFEVILPSTKSLLPVKTCYNEGRYFVASLNSCENQMGKVLQR